MQSSMPIQDTEAEKKKRRKINAPPKKVKSTQEDVDDNVENDSFKIRMLPIQPLLKQLKAESKAVVEYVFNNSFQQDEIIIKATWIDASRSQLNSLCSRGWFNGTNHQFGGDSGVLM